MRKLPIAVVFLATFATACAPAPFYASGSRHKSAVTVGEIPRDARGEPVWAAIRPIPGAATTSPAEVSQEGDAEADPTPPKA